MSKLRATGNLPHADPAIPKQSDPPRVLPPSRPLVATIVVCVMLVLLVIAGLASIVIGQFPVAPGEVINIILAKLNLNPDFQASHQFAVGTVWDVRLPRLLIGILVGAALAVAGALLQGVFGNPLAEPGVVGVSSGAAVAACSVLVFGWSFFGTWTVAAMAFVGGLVATLVVYLLSRSGGKTEVVTLVLTGIAINAIGGAAMAFLTFLGDTQAREQIVFWQLGSLNGTRWVHVGVVAPIVGIGLVVSFFLSRQLDLLSLGDRAARHVGVHVERLRLYVIVTVALLTAAAVAFCGIIGFVGLVIPHLIRMIVGPGHRVLIPASALGGALLLVCADLVARTAVNYADLPIGMLTALVGGPFFLYLIRKTRKSSGGWA